MQKFVQNPTSRFSGFHMQKLKTPQVPPGKRYLVQVLEVALFQKFFRHKRGLAIPVSEFILTRLPPYCHDYQALTMLSCSVKFAHMHS